VVRGLIVKAAMILLVGLYLDPDVGRQLEFITCLERNVRNKTIAAIHVFVEQAIDPVRLVTSYPQLASPKIQLVVTGTRLTYEFLFAYANRELPGRRVVIANADIFFDHTLSRLDDYDLTGCLLCLSRWDVLPNGSWQLFEFESSQDAWVFETPIPEFPADFHLGLLGCDNRLAWEADRAGLVLSNPSRSIRACHLHLTGVRRYTHQQRLYGPTRGVQPVSLDAAGIARRTAPERAKRPDARCAAVAFHETMGYTIERLELGASSHNNDSRPFTAIPPPLAGLSFTQVVSCSVSPVHVEFLSPGRLYVLVGTDWHGYYPATDWLRDTGDAEPLPLVETCHRHAFEVWSLLGRRGDRFVAPTQVMLVSGHLERR
jgi:hypothetical protein